MSDLKFGVSLTVEAFKAKHGSLVEIIRNPNTDKVFFTCGSVTGAVSDNYAEAPQFSEVTGEDDVPFWMLHKRSTDNVIATL